MYNILQHCSTVNLTMQLYLHVVQRNCTYIFNRQQDFNLSQILTNWFSNFSFNHIVCRIEHYFTNHFPRGYVFYIFNLSFPCHPPKHSRFFLIQHITKLCSRNQKTELPPLLLQLTHTQRSCYFYIFRQSVPLLFFPPMNVRLGMVYRFLVSVSVYHHPTNVSHVAWTGDLWIYSSTLYH